MIPLDDPAVVRILNPNGTMSPTAAAEPYLDAVAALTDAELESFYRDMALARAFDRQATNLQRQGQLALWPPSFGQEAAQVGSARAARSQDHIFPSYREHAVCMIRGVDPLDIIRLMRGVTHGGWDPFDPKNGNTHIYTLVLASQTLHATGFATGLVYDKKQGTGNLDTDEAVIVYYGDGASSQGDVHEAMVFAASTQTPQVFFLQNNQWAISVPVATQSRAPLYRRGEGYGMPSIQVDGNDVLANYAVTRDALDGARSGGGPRAIEAVTYRRGAHTTSDDPTKYRTSEEEEAWALRDPILRMRAFLENRGASESFFTDIDAEGDDLAEDARARTVALGGIPADSMFENVYSEPHPVIEEQRAWLARYEASMGEDAS
ncbi:pyruvate dehydrogenase E1 component alpha subunit [Microbacterium halimionae]|uniref:2-oxoisovalerate dehydrogenase subunit alpha n=2 Tax=Microbacterium halimionae TaxID=1526413 RepID=A0A7W3JQ69_9MICO|nr:thiamine pyrophosphate-dependent dehydrogenase E1 component subunit alpha [Microbacterium halimionae]MBA8816999.1 pyruvate dehydrogenase E1 component alpha subunit [Microbacterium halimionae]NII94462.1 pyruvate dehydrogenase E1 component alpha subunit [Microbacterium halimionae]